MIRLEDVEKKRILDRREVSGVFVRSLEDLSAERVAVVRNPSFVWAPYEFYPLSPPRRSLEDLKAVVMDMDGTTTTTEPLCLHSLEFMVRSITGQKDRGRWPGFDAEKDLPHVIGDSTTRHVEYLLRAYGDRIEWSLFARRFLWACGWTLERGVESGRAEEVASDLAAFGIDREAWEEIRAWGSRPFEKEGPPSVERAASVIEERLREGAFPERVRAAVAVYYQRYHEILAEIRLGGGHTAAREFFPPGEGEGHLIEPMPFVPLFLALVKGKLGKEGAKLVALLESGGAPVSSTERERFVRLCAFFRNRPAKLGIVTSSIRYEAEVVLGEVLRVVREQVSTWPVSPSLKKELASLFENPFVLYDAFVTASDSSEMRLKPHRDLYSIALHRLGLRPADYPYVLGLEDSTAGVVAIKAAGCGLCAAVPFEGTRLHDFAAADHVLEGGLREVMLRWGCFLNSLQGVFPTDTINPLQPSGTKGPGRKGNDR